MKEAIMIRRALAVLAVAVAVPASVSAPAVASDKAYYKEVKGRIELARTGLAATGWTLEQVFTGSLVHGGAGWATLPLEPGRDYRVVGRCDDDCAGLDLVLSRDELAIEFDADHDKVPSVDYSPRGTGNYTVAAHMVECTAATCRYGVALFSR
jgi:hypothetical protein